MSYIVTIESKKCDKRVLCSDAGLTYWETIDKAPFIEVLRYSKEEQAERVAKMLNGKVEKMLVFP